MITDRGAEYRHTLEVLKKAMPEMARALRTKNPRGPAPLTAGKFQLLVRMFWEHGYGYGKAHQLEQEAAMMRSVAAQIRVTRTEGYYRRAVRGQRKGLDR